jgi:protein ImuA
MDRPATLGEVEVFHMDQSVMASIVRIKAASAAPPAGDPGALRQNLRQAIRKLEGGAPEELHGSVSFGVAGLDAALGGGLARGALHEIAATRESDIPAATGFGLALAFMAGNETGSEQAERTAKRAVVWIAEDMALHESGLPYGPGLNAHGLPPERLITVAVAHGRDVLWAMEEALRSSAVGVVIGEVRRARLDLVASRRLTLAASGHGALGLILRAAPDPEASAAATRWIVGAAPSAPTQGIAFYGPGPPRVHAQLIRNRRGHLGSWTLEWNADHERFTTHSQPVPAASVDRPARAAMA